MLTSLYDALFNSREKNYGHDIRCDLCITMNTDIRIAILTLSRGIIQSKADPLRREKLCPNLLSPKFADAQMSSNFLPKFFVLKYIEPKVLAHKFLNTKVLLYVNRVIIFFVTKLTYFLPCSDVSI